MSQVYVVQQSPDDQLVVITFNNRSGNVMPQAGDYTADMVGAVPTSRTINGQALSADVTLTAEDIGGATNPVLYTATLPNYGWTNNSYTLTVPGILADEAKQLIMVTPYLQDNTEAY